MAQRGGVEGARYYASGETHRARRGRTGLLLSAVALLVTGLLLLVGPNDSYAQAQNKPDPTPEEAEQFGPPLDPNATARDRINLTTGNAYEQEGDLSIPGRGLPLRFNRTYNSKDTYNGPLGYGWSYDFDASLKEEEDGSVTYSGPQGARKKFTCNDDGSYAPPRGVHDTLTKAADGTFKLRKKNGVEWLFGASKLPEVTGTTLPTDDISLPILGGKLQKITDPNGNFIDLVHVGDRLVEILDTVGRSTALSYDADERISTITDPANRTVKYAYDGAGNLVSVANQAGDVTGYGYDGSHNLTEISNPDGGHVYFAYDDQNRAVSSSTDDDVYRADISYDPSNKKTIVKDSKGNQSDFSYNDTGEVTNILDPFGKELTYSFDSDGNRTSKPTNLATRPLSSTTRRAT